MRILLLPTLSLFISGCAAERANSPSLLPRAIETRSDAAPVRTVVIAPDAVLEADIARRSALLDEAVGEFRAAIEARRPMIEAARGDAAGSEPWIAAQAMLTDLGTARAASVSALVDLERLAIARATAGLPPVAALDARIESGSLEVQRQGEALTALEAMLRPV